MDDLTERIMSYEGIREGYEPIRSLDDLRTHYQEGTEVVFGIFRHSPVGKRINWERIDSLAESAINEIVGSAGGGMVREWAVYLRAKEVSGEELDAQLPGIVEEVYGSMVDYGGYGQSLIDLSQSLQVLLKKTKFSLIEKGTVKLYFSGIAKSFKETGSDIVELSKA